MNPGNQELWAEESNIKEKAAGGCIQVTREMGWHH